MLLGAVSSSAGLVSITIVLQNTEHNKKQRTVTRSENRGKNNVVLIKTMVTNEQQDNQDSANY